MMRHHCRTSFGEFEFLLCEDATYWPEAVAAVIFCYAERGTHFSRAAGLIICFANVTRICRVGVGGLDRMIS